TEHFGRWRLLLDELGVKEAPDHEDAFEIMREIARRQPAGLALTEERDELRVLQRCWQILELALSEDGVSSAEIRQRLGEHQVVTNAAMRLELPGRVFVEDQPGLRDVFGEAIADNCIARPRGAWAALHAAGVQGLRAAARPELVSAAPT